MTAMIIISLCGAKHITTNTFKRGREGGRERERDRETERERERERERASAVGPLLPPGERGRQMDGWIDSWVDMSIAR